MHVIQPQVLPDFLGLIFLVITASKVQEAFHILMISITNTKKDHRSKVLSLEMWSDNLYILEGQAVCPSSFLYYPADYCMFYQIVQVFWLLITHF